MNWGNDTAQSDHHSALTKTIQKGQNTENILALHIYWKRREPNRLPEQAYEIVIR
jgi:hypothetical protein